MARRQNFHEGAGHSLADDPRVPKVGKSWHNTWEKSQQWKGRTVKELASEYGVTEDEVWAAAKPHAPDRDEYEQQRRHPGY